MAAHPRTKLALQIVATAVWSLTLQPPPVSAQQLSGTSVIDAKGQYVGQIVGQGLAARKLNNQWLSFGVSAEGLATSATPLNSVYYIVAGCPKNGAAYLEANSLPLAAALINVDSSSAYHTQAIALYPGPATQITVRSVLAAITSISPLTGACTNVTPFSLRAGVLQISNLGPFSSPFIVK